MVKKIIPVLLATLMTLLIIVDLPAAQGQRKQEVETQDPSVRLIRDQIEIRAGVPDRKGELMESFAKQGFEARQQQDQGVGQLPRAKKEQALTPEQRVMKAMASPSPLTEIAVIVSATMVKAEGAGIVVALQFYIAGERLDYIQRGQKQSVELELYTSLYNERGKLVHGFKDKVDADLTGARAEQLKQNGLTSVRRVVLKPGLYNVRVGVREPSTDKMGTAVGWAEVPDLKKTSLAIGGIALSQMEGSPREEPSKEDVGLADMERGVPVFKRGNTLLFGATVFANAAGQAGGEDLRVQVELLSGRESVYKGPAQPVSAMQTGKDEAGIQIGGQVPVQMAAGVYELRIVVESPKAKRSVAGSALFRVDL